MPEAIATISAEQLSKLSGFSVGELTALARQGFFPRAANGQYEQNKAIPGCFKAYQAKFKEVGTLPTYQSMAECSTQAHVPRVILKEARKQSPESFRAHRILLGPLLKWIFSQNGDDSDWGERLKKAQALREEIRLAKDKDQALDKSSVTTAVGQAVSVFFGTLDRYSDELPSILHGLDAAQIKAQLSANIESIKTQLRTGLQTLNESKAKPTNRNE